MINKRPIIYISLAYLVGIILGRITNINLGILLILEIFLILLSMLFIKHKKKFIVFILLSFILSGTLIFKINEAVYNNIAYSKYNDFELHGIIISPIKEENNSLSFIIKLYNNNQYTNKNIFVLLKKTTKNFQNKIKYGEVINYYGNFRPITHLNDTSKEFYYKSKNIHGILYIQNENDIKIKHVFRGNVFKNFILNIKERLINVQNKTLPQKQADLLNGLIFGTSSSELTNDIKTSFINIGLIHLLVVSGAQVSIIISLILMLNKLLSLPKWAGFFVLTFFNISFAVLTGAEASILRASIMAQIMLIGELLERNYDSLSSLSLVAFILTIFNPYLIFSISFQLSFIATLSIIYAVPIIADKLKIVCPNFISNILAISLAPTLITYPIIAYHFNRISIISVFSNVLVISWVEFLVIFGFIASILGQISLYAAQLINNFNGILVFILLFLTKYLNKISWATININKPTLFQTIILYILLFYLLEKMRLNLKLNLLKISIAVLITLNLLIWPGFISNISDSFAVQKTNKLEVYFLDVGQGDSIFIRAPSGRNTLIDGGPFTKDFNYTKKVVYKFLRKLKVNKIDILILTHAHADHVGDLKYIIEKIPVGIILDPGMPHTSYLYKNLLNTIKIKKIPYRKAHIGQKLDYLNGIKGYILHPSEPLMDGTKSDLNNNCIVLKLVFNKTSFIFLGDLELDGEDRLLEMNPIIHSDVIKVSHHGSRNGTSKNLLSLINPKIAVISVGKNNSYNNPHKETIKRLEDKSIKIYRTNINGTITIFSDGQKISINAEK